jgi:hypothetical protein
VTAKWNCGTRRPLPKRASHPDRDGQFRYINDQMKAALASGSRRSRQQARMAVQRLSITVCHLPPGTSKWNKIEFITGNWRGKPLVSHQAIVELIAAIIARCLTRSKQLSVGIKVSDAELEAVNLRRHDIHSDWNYPITPKVLALEQ